MSKKDISDVDLVPLRIDDVHEFYIDEYSYAKQKICELQKLISLSLKGKCINLGDNKFGVIKWLSFDYFPENISFGCDIVRKDKKGFTRENYYDTVNLETLKRMTIED